jgi:putative spermidine/putrescine transport system substrate-binding protein
MSAVDRRTFLKGVGAAAVGVAAGQVVGCDQTDRAREGLLMVRDGGGAYGEANKKAIYDPFTEETGIRIKRVYYRNERMLAQLKNGRARADVIEVDMDVLRLFSREGVLEEIDYGRLKNAGVEAGIPDSLLTSYAVGKSYWASVLAYRADAFKGREPDSWADFWDTAAFPGERSLQSEFGLPELEFALLADGVPMDKLYPLDVDRAFRSLDRIKDSVYMFWDSGEIPGQLLSGRAVTATSIWNGRLLDLIKAGAPFKYTWNGARRRVNGYGIPKGAVNPSGAYRLIDYALRPDVQARAAEVFPSGPVVPAAYARVPRSIAMDLPSTPEHLYAGFDMNVDWWMENREAVNKRWREWAR